MKNFFDAIEILDESKNGCNGVVEHYNNNIVKKLSDNDKKIIEMYFTFKKIDSLNKIYSCGDWFIEKNIIPIVSGYEYLISMFGNDVYGIDDIDKLRDLVNKSMKNNNLLNIVDGFKHDLKFIHSEACSDVYTVLPIQGLNKLDLSKNRENRYFNNVCDGVYAISDPDDLQLYVGRACVGGMMVHGKDVIYPSNPFIFADERLKLNNLVSIYSSSVDTYEPQIDFDNGKFIFDGEWTSLEPVSVKENVVDFLPIELLDKYNISYGKDRVKVLKK